jgi:hypothetical protein
MGVKKNGTKKRKIRGGEIIVSRPSFFNGQKGNSVDSKNYAKKAMNTAEEIFYNLKFLVDDAISESKKPNNEKNKDTTKKRVNQFVAQMQKKQDIDDYKNVVLSKFKEKGMDINSILPFLDGDSDKQWLSTYLSEPSVVPSSSSTNINDISLELQDDASESGSILTQDAVRQIPRVLGSRQNSMQGSEISDYNPNISDIDSEDNNNNNNGLDMNKAPEIRPASVIPTTEINNLAWGEPTAVPKPKVSEVDDYLQDVTLFGTSMKRLKPDYVAKIDEDKKSIEKYKTAMISDITSITAANNSLKTKFEAAYKDKEQQITSARTNTTKTITELLAKIKANETTLKERNAFLQKQRDIIQKYLTNNPTIKLSELIATLKRQPEELFKAIIICINLNPNIPDMSEYYVVSPDTKLRDVMHGDLTNFIKVDDNSKTAIQTQFNKQTLQGAESYNNMFKNVDISNKVTIKGEFYKLLNELENVINGFLPMMSKINKTSKIAVSSGGAFPIPNFARSANTEQANQLREIYSSYYNLTKSNETTGPTNTVTEILDTINVNDVNEQLKHAIDVLKNIKISKTGILAAARQIAAARQTRSLMPDDTLSNDDINNLKYTKQSSSSTSGGSRKRKSPKKSARKTNKKQ